MNQGRSFKPQLTIRDGEWWAVVDRDGDVRTWAPIGRVDKLCDWKDIFGCLRMAHYYCKVGLLDSLTGPILVENGKGVVEIRRGTSKPGVTTL